MAFETDPEGKSPEQKALEEKIIRMTSGQSGPPSEIMYLNSDNLTPEQRLYLAQHAEETVALYLSDTGGPRHFVIPSANDPKPQS